MTGETDRTEDPARTTETVRKTAGATEANVRREPTEVTERSTQKEPTEATERSAQKEPTEVTEQSVRNALSALRDVANALTEENDRTGIFPISRVRTGAADRRRRTEAAVPRMKDRRITRVTTSRNSRSSTETVLLTEMERKMEDKTTTVILKDKERLDTLQRNGYQIIQNPEKFCFGMDAVLLSGFVKVKPGATVLDLGTGTGIIPILLEAKTKASHLTGLEIQEESADMARRSVALNGLSSKIDIVTGDIKEAGSLFKAASFDVVTSNPPYMIEEHGLQNPDAPKAIARHEILCTLKDVVGQGAHVLKPGGHFFMVHRPFRLAEIFAVMQEYKIEPKRMKIVYPYVDKEPNMVLIEGIKGAKPRMTVESPLIVYEKPGVYTQEIYDIYGY